MFRTVTAAAILVLVSIMTSQDCTARSVIGRQQTRRHGPTLQTESVKLLIMRVCGIPSVHCVYSALQ